MKFKDCFRRALIVLLCATVLLMPLPEVYAAPEDDEEYSDTYDEDTDTSSEDDSGEEEDNSGANSEDEDDTTSENDGSGDSESSDSSEDEDDGEGTNDGENSEDGEEDSQKEKSALADPGTTIGNLEDPLIEATAAMLVNPDTGMILYEKHADEKRYPASTTKIMTAIVTLENVPLADTVTAEASDFEHVTADSSNADIKEGETLTVEDLLYALMLPSANEAAYILARHVGGTWENFVDMMNAKAEDLGCTGTHFSNPCGLHQDDHYTTARDLLKMTEYAMKDDTFKEIVNTAQHRMAKTNIHPERLIFTTNQLTYSTYQPWAYAYCTGVKTGHTSQAGNCLVASAEKGKGKLYSIVLGCEDATAATYVAKSFIETKRLFEWGFKNFETKTLIKRGDTVTDIEVRLSADTDRLTLTAKNDLVVSVPKDVELEDMDSKSTVPESKDAPVKAGDVVGSLTYSYEGVDYGTVELVALTDVELSQVLYYADKLENFFKSTIFKGALVVLGVFFLLYIVFNLTIGSFRRRKQKHDMQSRYDNSNFQRRRRR